jgi:hypothetical protein
VQIQAAVDDGAALVQLQNVTYDIRQRITVRSDAMKTSHAAILSSGAWLGGV